MPDLTTHIVDINLVQQDPANARLHSFEQLEYIAKSLERFKQQKPIVVDKNNVIIAGNGTHIAARDLLHWDKIAVVYSELSAEEARAFGIADNQIPLQAEWDLTILTKHIQDIADWEPDLDWKMLGFEQGDIDPVLNGEEFTATPIDFPEDAPLEPNSKPGMGKPIRLTEEMREIIDQAINIVRIQEDDYTMTEGRAIELIAADFIAGARATTATI